MTKIVVLGAGSEGVVPPEVIARDTSYFESVVHDLVARGMTLNHS